MPLPNLQDSASEVSSWIQTSEGRTSSAVPLARNRVDSYEDDASRSTSPHQSSFHSPVDYDSEEDTDVDRSSDHKPPRVGALYQASLDGIYGSELAEDNAELLWDPDQMTDDALDTLLAQTEVGESTLHALASIQHSSPSTVSSPSPLHSSIESDSLTASMSSALSSPEDSVAPAKVLSLQDMLQVIHDSHYDHASALDQLKKRNLFGWSTKQSAFAQWTNTEKELFEVAMASYPKDFVQIANIVRTRNVGECVVYYYSWKHSERFREWLGHFEDQQPDLDEDPVPVSRMLPTSRKRKRDTVSAPEPLLIGGSTAEHLLLEALGSFDHPELMLNIALDSPSVLVEDNPLDDMKRTHDTLLSDLHQADNIHHHPHIVVDAFVPPSVSGSVSRLVAAASPKRPKLSDTDDHALLHSIGLDIHSSHNSVPATIDPSALQTSSSSLLHPTDSASDFLLNL